MQPKYNGFKKNPFAQFPIEPQFVSLAKPWRSLRETLIVHGGLCHLCRLSLDYALWRLAIVTMNSLPLGSTHIARCAGSSGVSTGGRKTAPPSALIKLQASNNLST